MGRISTLEIWKEDEEDQVFCVYKCTKATTQWVKQIPRDDIKNCQFLLRTAKLQTVFGKRVRIIPLYITELLIYFFWSFLIKFTLPSDKCLILGVLWFCCSVLDRQMDGWMDFSSIFWVFFCFLLFSIHTCPTVHFSWRLNVWLPVKVPYWPSKLEWQWTDNWKGESDQRTDNK